MKVIEYMRYRDKEIEEMTEALLRCDICRCNGCKQYAKDTVYCDICDNCYCDCTEVTHVRTWNLSGMNMCASCFPKTCHFHGCEGYVSCRYCRNVICEDCL